LVLLGAGVRLLNGGLSVVRGALPALAMVGAAVGVAFTRVRLQLVALRPLPWASAPGRDVRSPFELNVELTLLAWL
jgi:hypothetical protein